MLEHHGLNRCMDKGLDGFNRCVGLSILAYNSHILGNALQATGIMALLQGEWFSFALFVSAPALLYLKHTNLRKGDIIRLDYYSIKLWRPACMP